MKEASQLRTMHPIRSFFSFQVGWTLSFELLCRDSNSLLGSEGRSPIDCRNTVCIIFMAVEEILSSVSPRFLEETLLLVFWFASDALDIWIPWTSEGLASRIASSMHTHMQVTYPRWH